MATRLYSTTISRAIDGSVVEAVGPAVTTSAIELNVDLAQSVTREDVLSSIEDFRIYIMKGIWPPA